MADIEKQSLVIIEPPSGGGGGSSGCGSTCFIVLIVFAVLGVGIYFLYVDVIEPIISPIKAAANIASNPLGSVGGLIP